MSIFVATFAWLFKKKKSFFPPNGSVGQNVLTNIPLPCPQMLSTLLWLRGFGLAHLVCCSRKTQPFLVSGIERMWPKRVLWHKSWRYTLYWQRDKRRMLWHKSWRYTLYCQRDQMRMLWHRSWRLYSLLSMWSVENVLTQDMAFILFTANVIKGECFDTGHGVCTLYCQRDQRRMLWHRSWRLYSLLSTWPKKNALTQVVALHSLL